MHTCNIHLSEYICIFTGTSTMGNFSGVFSYQRSYHFKRSLPWPESLKNSVRTKSKLRAVKQRERGRDWEYETNIIALNQICKVLHQLHVYTDCWGSPIHPQRPEPAQNIMNVQDCLITPMYTRRVTLHPNMHLTVVQAVIAQGAYGLKCSAGKQIRVY